MYDSRTDKPTIHYGGRGYTYGGATNRWFKERGRGDFVRYGTPLNVMVARFGAKDAIAEGLADYEAEREEQAYQDYLDCEVMDWSAMGWLFEDRIDIWDDYGLGSMDTDVVSVYGDESLEDYLDRTDAEDMAVLGERFDPRDYDCDGPGMCHICTPGLSDD